MVAPVRALVAFRPAASPGVLAAAAAGTVVFSGTPFLIPAVADGFGVALGTAGLITAAQVGGFAVAAVAAGRLLRTSVGLLAAAGWVLVVANLASAFAPNLALLVGLRVVSGLAMGTANWIAWSDATRHVRGLADVAATGPIAATIASPVLAVLAAIDGHRLVYLALTAVAVVAVLIPAQVEPTEPVGRRVSGSRSNRVLLWAMFLYTLAGSSLFVFTAGAGKRAGLSVFVTSLGFSINALAGIVATRRHAPRGRAGLWMAATGAAAAITGLVAVGTAFLAGMILWGLAFWMAVPAVFRLLEEKSLRPDERVGDAQSLMAFGRVFGPVIGGAILGPGRFEPLTLFAAAGMLVSGATVAGVELRRHRDRTDPTDRR